MLILTEISREPATLSHEPITDAEAAAVFRAALNLLSVWGITDEQAASLLDVPPRTLARWKADRASGRLGRDGKARRSNLNGIH